MAEERTAAAVPLYGGISTIAAARLAGNIRQQCVTLTAFAGDAR
jgi:hypothetical protein